MSILIASLQRAILSMSCSLVTFCSDSWFGEIIFYAVRQKRKKGSRVVEPERRT